MNDQTNKIRWKWVNEYLRGEASVDTVASLEEVLQADDGFLDEFIEYANIDLGLAMLLDSAPEEAEIVKTFPSTFSRRKLVLSISTAAAACLLAGLWIVTSINQPFAKVVNRVGVENSAPIDSLLSDEVVHLSQGLLELETAQGARIVIEAPATFQFESAQELRLDRGRLAARVPPSATGFTVLTPTGQAIDLGTEFGVDVPEEGASEIHVFEGEVIAQSGNGSQRSLHGGEAFSLTSGSGESRNLRTAAFIRGEEFALMSNSDVSGRRQLADRAWKKLLSDPALITALNFENEADLPPGNFRLVQGRFPGTKAPEFARTGEHIKLNVGGNEKWSELTLTTWIRIDRIGVPYQSILQAGNRDEDRSSRRQLHWMVIYDSTIKPAPFGKTATEGLAAYPSSRLPAASERAQWIHLATVYDSVAGKARFYLNGQLDNEAALPGAAPIRLGAMRVGNWDAEAHMLSGRIDEFTVLGRTMSDAEIEELFESGTPYF